MCDTLASKFILLFYLYHSLLQQDTCMDAKLQWSDSCCALKEKPPNPDAQVLGKTSTKEECPSELSLLYLQVPFSTQ